MKKISKIGLSLVTLLLSLNVVNAAECEDLKMTAPSDWHGKNLIYMNYNNKNVSYSLYKLADDSNAVFSIYCRNPGKSSAGSAGETFLCDRKVFDSSSENEIDRLYDAGIIAILKNGYSTRNPNYNALKGTNGYVATNLALRVYEMLSPLDTNGTVKSTSPGLLISHAYYANLWREDAVISSLLQYIYGDLVPKKAAAEYKVTSWTDEAGNVITEEIEGAAKALLIKGLEAAQYYKDNGAATLKGVDKKPLVLKEPVVTDRNGKKTYKTSLIYTFEAEKFKSSDAYIKMDFNCTECSKYGVEYTLNLLDENDKEIYKNGIKDLSNKNLVKEYLKNGEGTIRFQVTFTASSDTYNCQPLDYKLNLEWFDETINVEAYSMYSKSCTSSTSCQHFYMLYATDVPVKKTITNSVELCSLACKDLEAQCNQCSNKSCDACVMFEKKYNSDCAECTTYIENAVCEGPEDKNIHLNEGYDVDTSNCGNIDDNNLNVLQCVINAKDPSDNSYRTTSNGYGNFENVENNEFCSVWCKEDYHFTLPGVKESNSGRYFSLKASISGTKTCYTSKIDGDAAPEAQFEDKADEARKEIIRLYNKWARLNAIVEGKWVDVEELGRTVWNTVEKSCATKGKPNCSYCERTTSVDCTTEGANRLLASYETYDSDGRATIHNNEKINFGYSYSSSGNCGSAYCEKKHYNSHYDSQNYPKQRDDAADRLEQAIESYAKLINDYNACYGEATYKMNTETLESSSTTGWKMEYKYNPTIHFWYEESYMENVITDKLNTVGGGTPNSLPEEHYSGDDGKKPTGDVQDKFIPISEKIGSDFACYKSGNSYSCGKRPIDIGVAEYIVQKWEVNANYITPTQFYAIYPSGAIVVAEEGKEDEIENSKELTNLLPIGLGTAQGVYNYTLKVENLGEYYNKKELGRLWGKDDSVVVTVLKEVEEENSCIKEGALTTVDPTTGALMNDANYVCAYKVNCPDCPVECDPTCKNPDCEKNDCPVTCEKCIYTNNKTNTGYKPISPGNINPNDREMGVNWKYAENAITTALELKAYVTTKEIEEAGEKIYDINYEDTVGNTEFAMQVKLNAKMINLIKTYNKQYENNAGYANNTLKCYDHTNAEDNITYDNIYCYSTFLDEIIEADGGPSDNGGSENIKIVGGTRHFTDADRQNKTEDSGYWTTWSKSTDNKWITSTSIGFVYNKNYKTDIDKEFEGIGVGPAWK